MGVKKKEAEEIEQCLLSSEHNCWHGDGLDSCQQKVRLELVRLRELEAALAGIPNPSAYIEALRKVAALAEGVLDGEERQPLIYAINELRGVEKQ